MIKVKKTADFMRNQPFLLELVIIVDTDVTASRVNKLEFDGK